MINEAQSIFPGEVIPVQDDIPASTWAATLISTNGARLLQLADLQVEQIGLLDMVTQLLTVIDTNADSAHIANAIADCPEQLKPLLGLSVDAEESGVVTALVERLLNANGLVDLEDLLTKNTSSAITPAVLAHYIYRKIFVPIIRRDSPDQAGISEHDYNLLKKQLDNAIALTNDFQVRELATQAIPKDLESFTQIKQPIKVDTNKPVIKRFNESYTKPDIGVVKPLGRFIKQIYGESNQALTTYNPNTIKAITDAIDSKVPVPQGSSLWGRLIQYLAQFSIYSQQVDLERLFTDLKPDGSTLDKQTFLSYIYNILIDQQGLTEEEKNILNAAIKHKDVEVPPLFGKLDPSFDKEKLLSNLESYLTRVANLNIIGANTNVQPRKYIVDPNGEARLESIHNLASIYQARKAEVAFLRSNMSPEQLKVCAALLARFDWQLDVAFYSICYEHILHTNSQNQNEVTSLLGPRQQIGFLPLKVSLLADPSGLNPQQARQVMVLFAKLPPDVYRLLVPIVPSLMQGVVSEQINPVVFGLENIEFQVKNRIKDYASVESLEPELNKVLEAEPVDIDLLSRKMDQLRAFVAGYESREAHRRALLTNLTKIGNNLKGIADLMPIDFVTDLSERVTSYYAVLSESNTKDTGLVVKLQNLELRTRPQIETKKVAQLEGFKSIFNLLLQYRVDLDQSTLERHKTAVSEFINLVHPSTDAGLSAKIVSYLLHAANSETQQGRMDPNAFFKLLQEQSPILPRDQFPSVLLQLMDNAGPVSNFQKTLLDSVGLVSQAATVNPDLSSVLEFNKEALSKSNPRSFRQRILSIFDKKINLEVDTNIDKRLALVAIVRSGSQPLLAQSIDSISNLNDEASIDQVMEIANRFWSLIPQFRALYGDKRIVPTVISAQELEAAYNTMLGQYKGLLNRLVTGLGVDTNMNLDVFVKNYLDPLVDAVSIGGQTRSDIEVTRLFRTINSVQNQRARSALQSLFKGFPSFFNKIVNYYESSATNLKEKTEAETRRIKSELSIPIGGTKLEYVKLEELLGNNNLNISDVGRAIRTIEQALPTKLEDDYQELLNQLDPDRLDSRDGRLGEWLNVYGRDVKQNYLDILSSIRSGAQVELREDFEYLVNIRKTIAETKRVVMERIAATVNALSSQDKAVIIPLLKSTYPEFTIQLLAPTLDIPKLNFATNEGALATYTEYIRQLEVIENLTTSTGIVLPDSVLAEWKESLNQQAEKIIRSIFPSIDPSPGKLRDINRATNPGQKMLIGKVFPSLGAAAALERIKLRAQMQGALLIKEENISNLGEIEELASRLENLYKQNEAAKLQECLEELESKLVLLTEHASRGDAQDLGESITYFLQDQLYGNGSHKGLYSRVEEYSTKNPKLEGAWQDLSYWVGKTEKLPVEYSPMFRALDVVKRLENLPEYNNLRMSYRDKLKDMRRDEGALFNSAFSSINIPVRDDRPVTVDRHIGLKDSTQELRTYLNTRHDLAGSNHKQRLINYLISCGRELVSLDDMVKPILKGMLLRGASQQHIEQIKLLVRHAMLVELEDDLQIASAEHVKLLKDVGINATRQKGSFQERIDQAKRLLAAVGGKMRSNMQYAHERGWAQEGYIQNQKYELNKTIEVGVARIQFLANDYISVQVPSRQKGVMITELLHLRELKKGQVIVFPSSKNAAQTNYYLLLHVSSCKKSKLADGQIAVSNLKFDSALYNKA